MLVPRMHQAATETDQDSILVETHLIREYDDAACVYSFSAVHNPPSEMEKQDVPGGMQPVGHEVLNRNKTERCTGMGLCSSHHI
jgi:hypothetical protein